MGGIAGRWGGGQRLWGFATLPRAACCAGGGLGKWGQAGHPGDPQHGGRRAPLLGHDPGRWWQSPPARGRLALLGTFLLLKGVLGSSRARVA